MSGGGLRKGGGIIFGGFFWICAGEFESVVGKD
jgi:hypothetical protein